jgi:hypothetical protein
MEGTTNRAAANPPGAESHCLPIHSSVTQPSLAVFTVLMYL